jgi:signal transduction histidine kinase
MNEQTAWILTGTFALFCVAIVLFTVLSYRAHIRRLEQILDDFLANGSASLNTISDTRESKLTHKLTSLLHRTSHDKETASLERDQISALLSDLSHQLKTPLANVIMYTELLEDPELTKEQRTEFSSQTRIQAEKMQWLMKDMLKATRLEHGILSFPASFQKIRQTIGMAVSGVYAQAEQKQISIITEPFSDQMLYHNPRWTAEAIGNILDNAIKYSPAGSRVIIRLCPMEIYSRIEIEDAGPGISPELYNEIFKRFYRGNTGEQQEGNGLGLYLSQLILNKEKGYVTVSSRSEFGSCFQIHLLNQDANPDEISSSASF